MKRTKISERCYNRDQSWYFEQTWKFVNGPNSFKLQVSIRRNAYDNQSGARVKMWDGQRWNVVVDVPITECDCRTISYTDRQVNATQFNTDATRLLDEAIQIVNA